MTKGYTRARMDFTVRIIRADDVSRTVEVELNPDERRYTKITKDEEVFYLDKYLKTLVSLEEKKSAMMNQMQQLPIFGSPREVDSVPKYAAKRRSAVVGELASGQYVTPEENASTHRDFQSQSEIREISCVSVDICGATARRIRDSTAFDRAYEIFLRELGTVVGLFDGSILKLKGDGFVAWLDTPGFTVLCDNTVDLGISLLVVLRDTVNPALEKMGLDPISIRVGADHGPAEVREFCVPATGFVQKEVLSDALNRAVKIEESCDSDQFRIGRSLYELMHVQWLERATEVPFDGQSVGIDHYKMYEVQ